MKFYDENEFLEDLREVSGILKLARMHKCQNLVSSIYGLGEIISQNGRGSNPDTLIDDYFKGMLTFWRKTYRLNFF